MSDERGVIIKKNGAMPQLKEAVEEMVYDTTALLGEIKKIVNYYGLTNNEWAEAISSQNFLVQLAKLLDYQLNQAEYKELFNVFLQSFYLQFDGSPRLAKDRILIIPNENKKLIACMQKEDEDGANYPARLRASAIINPDIIYQNYMHGIMVNIAAQEDNKSLKAIRKYCIDELFSDIALDKDGGWVHYRLPWITARVLLGMKGLSFSDRRDKDDLNKKINKAHDSLVDRIFNERFWRSGAGEWVSKWESTALCLEALIDEDYIICDSDKLKKINNVVAYLFRDDNLKEWISPNVDLSAEENSNNLLASVCLASVLYRLLKRDGYQQYLKYKSRIEKIFCECVSAISSGEKIKARQGCTITQILYYVAKAVK